VGAYALNFVTTGSLNTAIGGNAYAGNGERNTAIGSAALGFGSGSYNTAVGQTALTLNAGDHNTALGYAAGTSVTTANNVICIGASGADVSNSCYIGNIWIQPGGTQAVYVNSAGKLGFQVSSQRFKDEIKPMGRASEAIYDLRPVSFRYKKEIEPTRPPGFGLIAEDVDKIYHDLVGRDPDGKPNSVRYDAVNAMLLNEFLKEHRKNEEQEATIGRLEKQLETVNATLQKVSAQLELSKSAPQTAVND